MQGQTLATLGRSSMRFRRGSVQKPDRPGQRSERLAVARTPSASQVRQCQVVCPPPPWPRQATCPTRTWLGPRGCPLGHRLGVELAIFRSSSDEIALHFWQPSRGPRHGTAPATNPTVVGAEGAACSLFREECPRDDCRCPDVGSAFLARPVFGSVLTWPAAWRIGCRSLSSPVRFRSWRGLPGGPRGANSRCAPR